MENNKKQINSTSTLYRIKLTIAREKNFKISHNNEIIVPSLYNSLEEAKCHIQRDIQLRLKNSHYFRSYKKGFDLVYYSKEFSDNTYLSYRIMPTPPFSKSKFRILSA